MNVLCRSVRRSNRQLIIAHPPSSPRHISPMKHRKTKSKLAKDGYEELYEELEKYMQFMLSRNPLTLRKELSLFKHTMQCGANVATSSVRSASFLILLLP